jgi:transcriptional regulator
MYIPSSFAETRIDVMQALMRAHSLATLVIVARQGLEAHHLPMHLDSARGNSLRQEAAQGIDALAIFHGPQAYITPSWYATKHETGEVVPTWNYVTVHAHGRLRLFDDPMWLRAHLEQLVGDHESREALPWKIADAPLEFIQTMLRGIVGFEFEIARLEGKWKASQNHPAANREGVIEGLQQRATTTAVAMAEVVRERGPR